MSWTGGSCWLRLPCFAGGVGTTKKPGSAVRKHRPLESLLGVSSHVAGGDSTTDLLDKGPDVSQGLPFGIWFKAGILFKLTPAPLLEEQARPEFGQRSMSSGICYFRTFLERTPEMVGIERQSKMPYHSQIGIRGRYVGRGQCAVINVAHTELVGFDLSPSGGRRFLNWRQFYLASS